MIEHQFSGPWTEIKFDAVRYYFECCPSQAHCSRTLGGGRRL
jgi:hypothetical protein